MKNLFKCIVLTSFGLGLSACGDGFNKTLPSQSTAADVEVFKGLSEKSYEAKIVATALSDKAMPPQQASSSAGFSTASAIGTAAVQDDSRYQIVKDAIANCPVAELQLEEPQANVFRIQYTYSAPCPITGRLIMTLMSSLASDSDDPVVDISAEPPRAYTFHEFQVVDPQLQSLLNLRSGRTETNFIYGLNEQFNEITGDYSTDYQGTSETQVVTLTNGILSSTATYTGSMSIKGDGSVTGSSNAIISYAGKTLSIRSVMSMSSTGEMTMVFYLNGQKVDSIAGLEELLGGTELQVSRSNSSTPAELLGPPLMQ